MRVCSRRRCCGRRNDPMIDSLRRLVSAPRCLLCAGQAEHLLCPACNDDLPWNRCACARCARPVASTAMRLCGPCAHRAPPFDAAIAAFRYAAPVDQAIQRLKYSADFLAARWLGEALACSVSDSVQAPGGSPLPQLLVPVPLHAGRLRRRGYNQAHEIARVAGRLLGIPVRPGLARRLLATADQIGKSAAERRRNLRGAFAVAPGAAGARIALVDDVMTTGSTLAELAKACRTAGATAVDVWVVARVE